MSLQVLLTTLADGEFHSGDELGEVLGVTRTAVWKQVKKLGELGIPLESIKGKGYRVSGGLDLLSEDVIKKGLSQNTASRITELDIEGVIDSTNTKAMSKAIQGSSGYACTAEQQLAGKGRRGRQWSSPYAGSISLSIVWEFSGGVASLEGLSLAIGLAVSKALASVDVEGVKLKWPNDLLFDGKKLSGVLLEIAGDAQGPCRVVVGVGINVNTPKEKMESVKQPWIDVNSIAGQPVSRNQLVIKLLEELMEVLVSFEEKGFKAYRDSWQALDAYSGCDVSITVGDTIISGKGCGVDTKGAFIIETDKGRQLFSGGEISLRLSSDS